MCFVAKKVDGLTARWSVMLADDNDYIDVALPAYLLGVEILFMLPTKEVLIGDCLGEG